MLTLIEGGFFSGGADMIKDLLLRRTREKRRSYMIVPEQQTVSAEEEMTKLLPSDYPLYTEVTNFTRFADSIFRTLGGLAAAGADSTHRALIIYRVLCELRPMLRTFGGGEISGGTVERVIGAIRKMQTLSLGEAELLDSAEKLSTRSEERLRDKLLDLSLIMSLYSKILAEEYSASEDAMAKLARKLEKSRGNILSDCEIYIDGFTSFTEPQYKVIRLLMGMCNVTVHITLPKADSSSFEYTELRAAHERLVKIAARSNIDVKLKRLDGTAGVSNIAAAEICRNIWRSTPSNVADSLQNEDDIRIYEAENPYEECDFIAADIKRRVMMGERYDDFAIIARSIKEYEAILPLSFEKAGIPLFMSQSRGVDSFELIKLISSAYSAIASDFARNDVMSYAKCSLFDISTHDIDEFELYCERWDISGRRFADDEIWSMNPAGLDSYRNEDTEKKLLRINDTRRRLLLPLITLKENAKNTLTVLEHARILFSFLSSLNVEERLYKRAEEMRSAGYNDAADVGSRIFELVINTLDTIVDVLGKISVDLNGFISILKIAFSEAGMGQIPSFTEQVVAGSADTARIYGKRHVYIIGTSAGVFPGRVADDGFFGDNELSKLKALGLAVEPETARKSAMEYYYFCRALSFGSQSLTLLYPAVDSAFKPMMPSDAIGKIIEMSGGKLEIQKLSEMTLYEKSYSPSYALEHIGAQRDAAVSEALRLAGYGSILALSEMPIKNTSVYLSRETIDELYGKNVVMSNSRLEGYKRCPMKYFCSYNLSLDEGERAKWGLNHIGTFIHAVLENFFRALRDAGADVSQITEDERCKLTEAAAKKYVDEALNSNGKRTARNDVLIKRLSKHALPIVESLCDEFSSCKYTPVFFELAIGGTEPHSPKMLKIDADDGRSILIKGVVDRVDCYSTQDGIYLRVVDYKTGQKSFKPSDIERGENLQMFLYLKALSECKSPAFFEAMGASADTNLIPAGVLYVKADISNVKVSSESDAAQELIKNNQKRMGMLLNDNESISAMNEDFLPLSRNSDGSYSKRSRDCLYSLDGWEQIGEAVTSAVKNICKGMLSGDISASPLIKGGKGNACKYCAFKPICRNSNVF